MHYSMTLDGQSTHRNTVNLAYRTHPDGLVIGSAGPAEARSGAMAAGGGKWPGDDAEAAAVDREHAHLLVVWNLGLDEDDRRVARRREAPKSHKQRKPDNDAHHQRRRPPGQRLGEDR